MATYFVEPRRFLRRDSATTISRTITLSDLNLTHKRLESDPWICAYERTGELFPHLFLRPIPSNLNKYDAYIGAGSPNKVLAGMVAYRVTIPNNGIGLTLDSLTTAVNCDEFTTEGARISIEFSDSETPSTEWTTNREGSGFETSLSEVSISSETGWKLKKFLWIYVSLENDIKLNNGIPCGSAALVLPISITLKTGQSISGLDDGETISEEGFSKKSIYLSETNSAPDWPNIMKGSISLVDRRSYLRELYFGRFRILKTASSETYRAYGNFLLSSMLSNLYVENKTKSYDKDGEKATPYYSPLSYNQMCQQTNEDNLSTNPGIKQVGVGLVANAILNPESGILRSSSYDSSKILIHLNVYIVPVAKTERIYQNEIILENGSEELNLGGVGVKITAWFVKGKSAMIEDVNGYAFYISSALARDNNFWTGESLTSSGSITSEDGSGNTTSYSLSATKLGSIALPQIVSAGQKVSIPLESPIDDFGFIILAPWISDVGTGLSALNPSVGLIPSFDWKTAETNEGWKPAIAIR